MQPDSIGIASEPADDDLASVHSQGSLLVGELTTDLLREAAGICGVLERVLGAAQSDVYPNARGGRSDDLEQQVATGE